TSPTPQPQQQSQQPPSNQGPPPPAPPPSAPAGSDAPSVGSYSSVAPVYAQATYGQQGYGYPYGYGGGGPRGQGGAHRNPSLGNYQIQIMQSRMMQEQVRQAQVDTARKRMEWELEYEKYRPTAIKMKRQEEETDIDWAHNFAQSTEIWSGRTLNVLLTNILK